MQDEVPQQEFLLLTVQDSIPLQSRVVGMCSFLSTIMAQSFDTSGFPNGTLNEGETAR